MNKKKITALLLSSVMALTPAMPAMAEQSTIVNYVDGTTDSTVETPDATPTPCLLYTSLCGGSCGTMQRLSLQSLL